MRTKIKLATVNVIEMSDDELLGIRSFSETPKGNKAAEKLFIKLVKENEPDDEKSGYSSTKEDYKEIIDEGVWENGGYKVMLAHG